MNRKQMGDYKKEKKENQSLYLCHPYLRKQ